MIKYSLCNTCFQGYEIQVYPDTTHLLRDLIEEDGCCPCPKDCGGRVNLLDSPEIKALATDPRLVSIQLDIKEFFRAVMGAGLPDEIPTSPEAVDALLRTHRVVKTEVHQVGKFIALSRLVLENGLSLHLASGHGTAIILKITKEE